MLARAKFDPWIGLKTSYVHVLLQAIAQMNEMEENISCLGKFINDKEQPMELAQARLDTRTNRPNVELCCDSVQYRLIQEVHEIENSVGNLEARHSNARSSHKGLIRNQLDLEEDIGVNVNTLFIDEVDGYEEEHEYSKLLKSDTVKPV